MPAVKSSSAGLDKCLGGGFIRNSVNLLVGPVGSGKASFLLEQALQTSKQAAILYMSFDHGLREFAQRSALAGGIVSLSDLLGQLPSTEASGVEARKYMAGMIERFRGSLPDNFFFSGIENLRSELDVDETTELARMLPDEENKIVIIESLSAALLKEPQKLTALKQIAVSEKLTFLISLHEQVECGKRPHFIEGADQELLERFQRHTDSIAVCSSEKINLRKFVAMVKGQIDAQLVGKLEQKALQLAGNKRLKTDSYSLMRVIHSRYGRRELLLYLYQPDFVRFFEIASIPLGRP
jgi:KaiC/GvpD/RAD55 family RecA-like ATPase